MINIKIAFVVSFFIHCFVFVIISISDKKQELKEEIVSFSVKETYELQETGNILSLGEGDGVCDVFFGGIGVTGAVIPNEGFYINEVIEGYPASQIGIMIGDMIEPINGSDIRGNIGSVVAIKVTRKNKTFYLNATRAKICSQ